MSGKAQIEVEGLREFQQALKRQVGKMPKALGEAHKEIGRLVIDKLEPRPVPEAVGMGAGSTVRPSATKREVLLRVGGSHRAQPGDEDPDYFHRRQWGKRQVGNFREAPQRPFIVGTIQEHQPEIEQKFLDEMTKMLKPAFYSAE